MIVNANIKNERPRLDLNNVLPFYLQKADAGRRVCLVTLVNVDGTSPRPLGSQIAVSQDGDSFGFITGGCAEQAIVQEALVALAVNKSRLLRIGSDSPWFDIKLPCGSGLDLHFSVSDWQPVIHAATTKLAHRQPATLKIYLNTDHCELVVEPTPTTQSNGVSFLRCYDPATRLVIVGTGPCVESLGRIALETDMDVEVWSPNDETLRGLPAAITSNTLCRENQLDDVMFDAWTAAVLLFHQHDWEPEILQRILTTDCFFVGALGSNDTHINRIAALNRLGVSADSIAKIAGPVGLPINSRTPNEIAISILSQLILEKNKICDHRERTSSSDNGKRGSTQMISNTPVKSL